MLFVPPQWDGVRYGWDCPLCEGSLERAGGLRMGASGASTVRKLDFQQVRESWSCLRCVRVRVRLPAPPSSLRGDFLPQAEVRVSVRL